MVGFTKCLASFSLFFARILDFSVVCGGVRGKVNSAFDRARRVLSWFLLLRLWSPLCANPSGKYANPDPEYPTLVTRLAEFLEKIVPWRMHFAGRWRGSILIYRRSGAVAGQNFSCPADLWFAAFAKTNLSSRCLQQRAEENTDILVVEKNKLRKGPRNRTTQHSDNGSSESKTCSCLCREE